jgi:transcriptional regulator with XRE-family HTH domain
MEASANETGKYHRPTPAEIAYFVKELRRLYGWKQFTLADEAGVNQRTIERLEAGKQRMDDDTLRKVAKALKLSEGALIQPIYRPSDAEIMAEVKRAEETQTVVELHDITEARDLENILGQDGHYIDGSGVEEALADAVAALKDLVQDWGDIFDDVPNLEQLNACRQILAAIREIEERGYTGRWGRYTTHDNFNVGVLVIFKKSNLQNFRHAVVPRLLMGNI